MESNKDVISFVFFPRLTEIPETQHKMSLIHAEGDTKTACDKRFFGGNLMMMMMMMMMMIDDHHD